MRSISGIWALIFIGVIAFSCLSLLSFTPVNAQAIPKPSVAEFSLQYNDKSYYVPPTYGVDPYTGKNVMTHAGYYVKNASVDVTIKNQPFTAYQNQNGSMVYLFYVIETKGHFEDWNPYYADASYWLRQNLSEMYPTNFVGASNTQNTIVTFGFEGDNATVSSSYSGGYGYTLGNIAGEGKVDFRIQAVIGYSTRYNDTSVPGFPSNDPTDPNPRHYVFTGEFSDWSNTETISIPSGEVTISETTNPTASTTPTAPELPWLAIVPLLLSVLSIALILKHKRVTHE